MIAEITLNGVKVKRELPTSWSQVKFRDFLKIANDTNNTTLILSVLTGIEAETIKKARIPNLDSIILSLSFFQKEPELKVPDTILGYKVPKDLGFECIAQLEDLKLHLKECHDKKLSGQEQLAFYPLYCAIYACIEKSGGEYDYEKAKSMADEFLEAPATEVLAIGNFTLSKLIALNLGISPNSHKQATPRKRLRLALKSWVKSLVLPVQLAIWRRRLATKKTN